MHKDIWLYKSTEDEPPRVCLPPKGKISPPSLQSLFFLLLWSFVTLAFSVKAGGTDPIKEIQSRGTLRVGMTAGDYPPYIISTKSGLTGLEVSLARTLASFMGVRLQIIRSAQTPDDLVALLEKGEVDLGIATASITPERALRVNFSQPYMILHKAIILNRLRFNALRAKEEETLRAFYQRGYSIGVCQGSAYRAFASQLFPRARIVAYRDWGAVMKDLEAGKIEGAMNDQFEVLKAMWSSPRGGLLYLPIVLKEGNDPIGIMVPKEALHFLNWINWVLVLERLTFQLGDLQAAYESYLRERAA